MLPKPSAAGLTCSDLFIIDNTLKAYVIMSIDVCVDLWSHASSMSYNKVLMSCIEKKSESLFCKMRKLLSVVEEVLPQH